MVLFTDSLYKMCQPRTSKHQQTLLNDVNETVTCDHSNKKATALVLFIIRDGSNF